MDLSLDRRLAWARIAKQWGLIGQLVAREVRSRYVGSAMGLFWSVIHPVITLAVYTYVFSYILKVRFNEGGGTANFAIFLFCGMLPWLSFQETVQRCTTSITENASLVKNLRFPAKSIQFSIAFASLFTQFIGLGILTAAIVVLWGRFPYLLPLIVPMAFFAMLFSLGLGFVFCTFHVFFRDTAQLVSVLLMLWLYLTPIFYPSHIIPPQLQFVLYVNPLAYAANIYRHILLNNGVPELHGFAIFVFLSTLAFVLGYRVYTRFYGRFIDEL
jgi:ABC-type polysaccharide/polyol phosphate export permease